MIRPIEAIIRLAKGLAKTKKLGYSGIRGKPIMSVAEPIATGRKISRRDFLGRLGMSADELRLQNVMVDSANEIKNTQTAAIAWLRRPDIQKRIMKLRNTNERRSYPLDEIAFQRVGYGQRVYDVFDDKEIVEIFGKKAFPKLFFNSDPSKMSPFKMKLRRKINEAKQGYNKEIRFGDIKKMVAGDMKPRTSIEKWFSARQKLSKEYGHRYGTGTYLNEMIPLPPHIKGPITGRYHQSTRKEIIDFVKDLGKNPPKKQNPIVEAFLEGLKK